ncbi:hypothetical protein B484DRAFT_443306 [Ochromonadaceae sp. CCMP2298]|nr:hypothetical protein B484DRAFT_443306 [Ochromonadaceae sp. CCMP2298]
MSTMHSIHRAHLEYLSQYDGVLEDEALEAVWAKVLLQIGEEKCSVLYVMGLAGYEVMRELGLESEIGAPVVVNVSPNGANIVEDSIKVEPFDLMDEAAAKQYFLALFASWKQSTLVEIWDSLGVGGELHSSEKMDAAIQIAVDRLDADDLGEKADDGELAAKLSKADRRRESKKRSKARKKWTGELETALAHPKLACLSVQQREMFTALRDLFRDMRHQVSTDCLLDALYEKHFNADAASDLIFQNMSSAPIGTNESSLDRHTPSKMGVFTKMAKKSKCTSGLLSTGTVEKEEEPEWYSYFLLDHYLAKLRHNNRGIIVHGEGGCIEFGGMETGEIATRQWTGTVNNTGGLVVSIDLHGLTRRPCWEVVTSSLVYYRNVLRVSSNPSARHMTVRDSRYSTVQYIQVQYIVGRGVHSPSAVPVLRRMVLQVLSEFAYPIEVHPYKDNDGEIQIVLKA